MPADTDQPTLAVTAETLNDIVQPIMDRHAEYMGTEQVFFSRKACANMIIDALAQGARQVRHRTNSEPCPAGDLREAAQRVVDDYPAAAGACASIEGGDGKPGWGSIRRLADVLATHSPAPMAGEVTEPESLKLLAIADAAIAADDDHLDAPNADDLAWLAAQLACWPTRVDPSCTTNDRFLRMSAAHFIRQRLAAHPSTQEGSDRG